jgi:hypothetical protein
MYNCGAKRLNRCKYDLMFPCPVTMVVKLWVMFIFIFSLSTTIGRYSFVVLCLRSLIPNPLPLLYTFLVIFLPACNTAVERPSFKLRTSDSVVFFREFHFASVQSGPFLHKGVWNFSDTRKCVTLISIHVDKAQSLLMRRCKCGHFEMGWIEMVISCNMSLQSGVPVSPEVKYSAVDTRTCV